MPLNQTPVTAQPEKAAGQNTIGFNVEQILAEAGNNGYYPGSMGNTTQGITIEELYTTQNIPVQQDVYATQTIPTQQELYATQTIPTQQELYATQTIPTQQELYATQTIPTQQELYATQTIPTQQELYATQAIPTQKDIHATQTIPTQQNDQMTQSLPEVKEESNAEKETIPTIEEQPIVPLDQEDLDSLEANKLRAKEETGEETEKEADKAEETAETVTETVTEENGGETLKTPEESEPADADKEEVDVTALSGSTVRVDTAAVNAAIQEAAATMDVSGNGRLDGTQDIESTMAMVEAALADETRAAQFDARMDMPEYSEEYTAPVKDKITLRAFQPEIDKIYEIPMEVKRYFTKYSYVSGLEAQIGEYFESTKYEEKMGTSGIGNIIISGNRSSDKTTLAINIVKALNTLYSDNVRKIARTNGDSINQRGIERSISKLLGSALIIEEAGVIDRQRILELVEVMESDTQEMLIILEDSESEINELLKNNPELIEKFNHRITYKQFTVNELVEMCKRYADKCQYTIDEKALLQLYLRIDEIHSNSDGVSLEDVRDVIDTAIEYADKRASKKIFGGAKKKKIGDKEYTVLIESDFKE